MSSGHIPLAVLLATAGGFVGLAPAADDNTPSVPALSFAVEPHLDIPYRADPAADPKRHRLDVYTPKGRKDFPVLFFVYGGSWQSGDKREPIRVGGLPLGSYAQIGETFARAGYGVVIPNYRLSPQVKHPAHIEDVAAAFAWTVENVRKNYGGRADRVFAIGHSAGGHLVSLLATDPTYLKAVKHTPADIRGVVSISGVYQVVHDKEIFHTPFGKTPDICEAASPLTHVCGNHPPFLIAYADKDFEHLDEMAYNMNTALKMCKSPTTMMPVKDRNHFSILMKLVESGDPLQSAIHAFVKKYSE